MKKVISGSNKADSHLHKTNTTRDGLSREPVHGLEVDLPVSSILWCQPDPCRTLHYRQRFPSSFLRSEHAAYWVVLQNIRTLNNKFHKQTCLPHNVMFTDGNVHHDIFVDGSNVTLHGGRVVGVLGVVCERWAMLVCYMWDDSGTIGGSICSVWLTVRTESV
jgi:hypothetical protein